MTLELALTELTHDRSKPLLIVGPSLGTEVEVLWGQCAQQLADDFLVVGWDLPGHGSSRPDGGFGIPDLSDAVVRMADGITDGPFH